MHATTHRQAGFMGVESLGSLVFYLFMIAAAALLVYNLMSGGKLSETQQSISSIRMSVQQMFASSLDYTGLTNDLAIKAGLVPKKLIKGGGILNSWGGAIAIATGDDTGTFTITLDSVPQDACTKLATYQLESWLQVEVNNTAIGLDTAVAAAAENCEASNSIIYTAR